MQPGKNGFHVNRETQEVGPCNATIKSCKVGGAGDHFDDLQSAAQHLESVLNEEYGHNALEPDAQEEAHRQARALAKRRNAEKLARAEQGNEEQLEDKEASAESSSSSEWKQYIPKDSQGNIAPPDDPQNFDELLYSLRQKEIELKVKNSRSIQRALATGRKDKNGKTLEEVEKSSKQFLPLDEHYAEMEFSNPSEQKNQQEFLQRKEEIDSLHSAQQYLNNEFKDRGGWNRAYLVTSPNGHVHKTTNCATCNKNGKQTEFEWRTEFSGASEKKIVDAAGYRACTTCYPDAPVGNSSTLPTKMLTEKERKQEQSRIEKENKKAQQKAKAINNAPTVSGAPLEVGFESFKTESSASSGHNREMSSYLILEYNRENNPQYSYNQEMAKEYRENSLTIVKSLAEKNNRSIAEQFETMRPAIERKIKQDNKEMKNGINPDDSYNYVPMSVVKPDYGLTEEQLNAKPSDWDF